MPLRLLMILGTIITITVPALAQNAIQTSNVNVTPSAFVQLKTQIDSLAQWADTERRLDHAAFNGKARAGRYRVECFYNTDTKEILKANYLFITDSLNFNKVFYFKGNSVVKINDNNTSTYYQVSDHLYNEQGNAVNPTTSKYLMGIISDTWQGLYAALFQ